MSAVSATPAAGTTSGTSCAVFTTPGCPYCKRAKALLTQQQLPYQEVDVSTSSALRQALAEATGRKTVPQVTT
jgi:glutaredoxin 3